MGTTDDATDRRFKAVCMEEHSMSNGLAEARRHLQEAQACLEEERLGAAAQACERALQRMPNWAEALRLQGQVLEQMGFVDKAHIAYERADGPGAVSYDVWAGQEQPAPEADGSTPTGEGPTGSARKLLQEAHSARQAGKLGSALRKCEAALRQAPHWAEAHRLRGTLLDDLGHHEQALVAYREAAHLRPSPGQARPGSAVDGASGFVAVHIFALASHAHIARGRLAADGIPSFVTQEERVSLNWLFSCTTPWARLYVRQQDAERALALLDRDWSEASASEPRCPQCNSRNAWYEKYDLPRVYAAILLLGIPIPFKKETWTCRQCGATWPAEPAGDLRPFPIP
jgi:tetratricopeptide (TPR) repeat protein